MASSSPLANIATSDGTPLELDIYRPAGAPPARRPTMSFFNRATGKDRS
ncbi:MAG: hypothetical protein M3081_00655 [Gemmatimonadota bacterium]|nr:hypothetical protein [Gemmatimonadota bacterium]